MEAATTAAADPPTAPARQIVPACAYEWPASNALITAEHVATLNSRGMVVIDAALTAEQLAQCDAEIQEVKALAATEGGFKDNAQLKEVRSDRVRWLHEDDSTVSALMEAMQGTQALRETVVISKQYQYDHRSTNLPAEPPQQSTLFSVCGVSIPFFLN